MLLALCVPTARAEEELVPVNFIQPQPTMPSDEALEAAGAIIGSIAIDAGEVFTDKEHEANVLAGMVDRLHINTRASTIRSQLLFNSGDRYKPRLLQESERLLRANGYLGDARIYPVAWHDGVVDVEVRTRDVWTLDFSASFGRKGGTNSSSVQLADTNLAGLGLRLGLGRKSDVDRVSTTLRLATARLGAQRWALDASYSDNSDGYERNLYIGRPFYSLDTTWTAGAQGSAYERRESRYALGQIIGVYDSTGSDYEIFGGHSSGTQAGWVTRWTYGVAATTREFRDAQASADPGVVAPPPWPLPEGRQFIYPWLAWERIQDNYITEQNLNQIGKTEDWHAGWQMQARVGLASQSVGSTSDAVLMQAQVSRGYRFGNGRLLDLRAGIDGRLEGGHPADALATVAARYYFPTSTSSTLFLGASADYVRAADADRQLLLGGDNGLRGYPLRFLESPGPDKARWLVTAEERWYSNRTIFHIFNVGAAAFYDAGATPGNGLGVLQDVGVGIRLLNNRSARAGVLHIDLALPLTSAPGVQGLQLLIATKKSF
ncbi:MAG: hypothetical protein RL030_1243 [Pseudomonadota bacterium]